MFRLIIDKSDVNDFVNVIAPFGNIDPSSVNKSLYFLLRQHSRLLNDSVIGDTVFPVRMLVTIRTDLSDEVLVPDDGKFYTDCTASYFDEHPLDDAVMLSAKSLVDRLFDCGDEITKVIQRTSVLPFGACFYEDQVYVYVNVVIDHTLKNEDIFKVKGCHFEPITSLSSASPLEKSLLSSLILVKGGSK